MTVKKSNKIIGFIDLIGPEKAKEHFFKVRSDLIGKAVDVTLERCKCGKCGEDTMFAWIYRMKDEDFTREELVDQYCGKCRDQIFSQEITLEMNQKRKDGIRANWYHPTYENVGFKSFNAYNNVTRKALTVAKEFTKRIIAGEKINLLMLGSPGTGKTFLASAIARTLDDKGMAVGFITAVELFDRLKDAFKTPGMKQKIFNDMKSLDLLCIDDVGVESVRRNNEVSWTASTWAELVTNRMGLPCVYSSNFDDVNIREVIGDRATSRLYENSMFVDMFTEDYRKRKQIII